MHARLEMCNRFIGWLIRLIPAAVLRRVDAVLKVLDT